MNRFETLPIVTGAEARQLLTDDVLQSAMDQLTRHTYDLANVRWGAEPRMRIAEAMDSASKMINGLLQSTRAKAKQKLTARQRLLRNKGADAFQQCRQWVYPKWTLQEECRQYIQNVLHLLSQGQYFVLPVQDGHTTVPAAMGGYKFIGNTTDQRKMFMTTKHFTFPEYRHQGLFRTMYRHTQQTIRQQHENSPILSMSKDDMIIDRLTGRAKQGDEWVDIEPLTPDVFGEITIQECFKIRDPRTFIVSFSPAMIQEMEKNGWRAALFDPTSHAE